MSSESDRRTQSQIEAARHGSITRIIPTERDVVEYAVSDQELDSLSDHSNMAVWFITFGVAVLTFGSERLAAKDWMLGIAMIVVSIPFFVVFVWHLRRRGSLLKKIRENARPISTSQLPTIPRIPRPFAADIREIGIFPSMRKRVRASATRPVSVQASPTQSTSAEDHLPSTKPTPQRAETHDPKNPPER